MYYRPGHGAMHRLPDALSRNPDCREVLSLARIGDWTKQTQIIRGIQAFISSGEPISLSEFLSWDLQMKGECEVRVQFFDSAGREVYHEDISGVRVLQHARFKPKFR